MMLNAEPVMKPATAFREISSTKKPKRSIPNPVATIPQSKQRVVAMIGAVTSVWSSGYFFRTSAMTLAVYSDITATGQIQTSFDVANKEYINAPIKEEYKPYSGDKLAICAYDIDWGTSTQPTVIPATKSA